MMRVSHSRAPNRTACSVLRRAMLLIAGAAVLFSLGLLACALRHNVMALAALNGGESGARVEAQAGGDEFCSGAWLTRVAPRLCRRGKAIRGQLLAGNGQLESATQKWLGTDWAPKEAEMLTVWARNMGQASESDEEWPAAEAYYHLALALPTNVASPDVLFSLGLVQWEQGKLDEALVSVRDAARETDDQILCSRAHNAAGRILHAQGNYRDAVDEFFLAIQLAPERLWYRLYLGYAYCALGEVELSNQSFAQEWQMNPDVETLPVCKIEYDENPG